MQVGILTTDGGPHPADKWARMTAWMLSNHLIQIDEKSTSALAVEMREARDDLNSRLYKVLKGHHATVQTKERAALETEGTARLSKPLNDTHEDAAAAVAEHVDLDAIVAAVVEEAKIHPKVFEHFSADVTREAIRAQLVRDFSSAIHIERSWRADGHRINKDGRGETHPSHDPRCPHVQAFKAKQAPGFAADAT